MAEIEDEDYNQYVEKLRLLKQQIQSNKKQQIVLNGKAKKQIKGIDFKKLLSQMQSLQTSNNKFP